MMLRPSRVWPVVALLVVVFGLPLLASRYLVWILTEITVWSLFAVSFNLVYGYTGLLSFGHAALFGLGMYGFAFAASSGAVLPLAALAGVTAGTLGALVLGIVAVQVRGHGFAIVTLVVASILYTLAVKFKQLSGGDEGISFSVPSLGHLRALGIRREVEVFYLVVIVAALVYIIFAKLVRGRLGLALRLVRDNEQRAEFLGYNTTALKLAAIVISGAIAGLAGSLSSLMSGYASTDFLHWVLSADVILWTFLGGVGTVIGPLIGAGVLIFVKDAISTHLRDIYPILVGCLIIAIVTYLPEGIAGALSSHLSRRGPWSC